MPRVGLSWRSRSDQLAPQARLNVRALEMIDLLADFNWMGPVAFEHCTRFQAFSNRGGCFCQLHTTTVPQTDQVPETHWREAGRKCSSANSSEWAKKELGGGSMWSTTLFEMRTKLLTLPSWIPSLLKPVAAKKEWEKFMISCAEATLSDTVRS